MPGTDISAQSAPICRNWSRRPIVRQTYAGTGFSEQRGAQASGAARRTAARYLTTMNIPRMNGWMRQ